jgi:hypothetical protein
MTRFSFWQRWLVVVGVVVSVFGVMMALLSGTQFFDLFNRRIDPAFWGTHNVDSPARQFRPLRDTPLEIKSDGRGTV